jgi:hypothetical protein
MDYEYRYPSGNLDWCRLSVSQNVHTTQATVPITQIRQRPRRQFSCFIWTVTIHERLAANPEKAHTRDAPRTNTASGMPNAMLAHIPRVTQGFGGSRVGILCSA